MNFPNFGFTNEIAQFEKIKKFKEKAIADGWECTATYPDHESIERACTLTKDGFKMLILLRDKKDGKFKYETCISLWGSDGLGLEVPDEYSFEDIKLNTFKCMLCGAKNVDTFKVAFAGRVCKNCLPEANKKYEFKGWCD